MASDFLYKGAVAGDGDPRIVGGDLQTIMAGLACGEPNIIGWDILRNHVSAFVSCPDWVAAKGMRMLAAPVKGDPKVISGESGAVGMGVISTIMQAAGFGQPQSAVLPSEIVSAIEDCGFFESIPLWAVTLIGGLLITVLSFVMIMTVYGRFFKLYLYTAISPVPLAAFAGEPSQSIGVSFLKSYAAVCLEGVVIALCCVIYSAYAAARPDVSADSSAAMQVLTYIGELTFNMLVLVGLMKGANQVTREMLGL